MKHGGPRAAVGTRRRLISGLVGIGASVAAAPWLRAWRSWWQDDPAIPALRGRPLWPLDVDGDGRIGLQDLRRVERAMATRRGEAIAPLTGWDGAADVLGHGRVTAAAVRVVSRALGQEVPPRPPLACWHYGWYPHARRGNQPVTVRYRGGPYASGDAAIEERFNDLKREFGIDADLLSWVRDGVTTRAYERGYMQAANAGQRRVGLLYESNINLQEAGRIDFAAPSPITDRMIADFERMGDWLQRAASRVPAFVVDGRPVIYLFGSHTFGTTWDNLPHVGRALTGARAAFTRAFGTAPYLIGDEALFPADDEAGPDRLYRASHFDAVGRYHHYDERQVRALGADADLDLDAAYLRALAATERRTMATFASVRNRYTDAPVRVLPSSAAGFAKRDLPRLRASGDQYRALLLQSLALAQEQEARLSKGDATPAPVLVGSWNEEYEGHALMPARSNAAMREIAEGGFDWLYAIRSVYGVSRG